MPDIDVNSVESIESIKKKYPELRQKSKTVSFAAQYEGTHYTFMKSGFPEEEAKEIYKNYHKMYQVSDKWTASKLKEAASKGYVELAFGLRLRTPILKQVLWGSSKVPYEAQKEARTAGNAFGGQSYGLLNNRASNAFMELVWASEYADKILPVALIHDAIYLIVKRDPEVLHWVNTNLIKCMSWQDLPELKHDNIKLGAELDLYPTWSNPITLPNNITEEEIAEYLWAINLCENTRRN